MGITIAFAASITLSISSLIDFLALADYSNNTSLELIPPQYAIRKPDIDFLHFPLPAYLCLLNCLSMDFTVLIRYDYHTAPQSLEGTEPTPVISITLFFHYSNL